MPELPEVETIRTELAGMLVGRTVRSAKIGRADIVGFPSARKLELDVRGRRVVAVRRTGKYLVLQLSGNRELIFHLRLSGHLELGNGRTVPRFERARFVLSGGKTMSFIEPRALGRVYLVRAGKHPRCLAGMARMGLEPIAREFTSEYLAGKLADRKASIKSLLLDQRVCCGVGNIYSDEALFRAGISPTRPAGKLAQPEVRRLGRALRSVLRAGIRWCGTTLEDRRYRRPAGAQGEFQKHLKVVGREGQRCSCGGTIERIKFGNRSSYFCPRCQH